MEPQVVLKIRNHVRRTGEAPTTEDIREMADFHLPGGMSRLIEGLHWLGEKMHAQSGKAARSA